MGGRQGIGHLQGVRKRLAEGQAPRPDGLGERFAVEVLHHETVAAGIGQQVMYRDDVRMIESGGGLRFL